MADRFFCPDPPADGRVKLGESETYHLARVRRVGEGEEVELFDGQGGWFRARVERIAPHGVELVALGELQQSPPPPLVLTLATAVPKGDRFDWLVEKATEIGVARLVPLETDYAVVLPGRGKLGRAHQRVIAACKQCGRNRLMEVEKTQTWKQFLSENRSDAVLVAHPGGIAPPAWTRVPAGQTATLAIGPEGGFSEPEIAEALALGWQTASLGRNLLRIETAGLAGAAIWIAQHEENLA